MAAPCTEHLFLTGRKGVGKSTLLRALLEGKRLGGFFTRRMTGVFDRPSIHLLRAASAERPAPENLVCFCGERRPERFELLGPAALADTADCDIIVMDELGPSEAAAQGFQAAVLAALDGDTPVRRFAAGGQRISAPGGGTSAGAGGDGDGGEPGRAAPAAPRRKVNQRACHRTASRKGGAVGGTPFFGKCPFLWTADTV